MRQAGICLVGPPNEMSLEYGLLLSTNTKSKSVVVYIIFTFMRVLSIRGMNYLASSCTMMIILAANGNKCTHTSITVYPLLNKDDGLRVRVRVRYAHCCDGRLLRCRLITM